MFVTKTLEDPLRRVPLLAVNRAILFQNAVDDIRERRQLRALRRRASPISRRFRMQQYLGNRLAVDPELARSFPSAQTLTMTRQSHSSIKIHSVHPPPSIRSILTKAIDGPILVRRRNRTNRPLHWGIIAPPFSLGTKPSGGHRLATCAPPETPDFLARTPTASALLYPAALNRVRKSLRRFRSAWRPPGGPQPQGQAPPQDCPSPGAPRPAPPLGRAVRAGGWRARPLGSVTAPRPTIGCGRRMRPQHRNRAEAPPPQSGDFRSGRWANTRLRWLCR